MKRLHIAWMLIAALLLAGSAGWGYVSVYAAGDTVPKGVTAQSGKEPGRFRPITLGGMKIDEALGMLDSREEALLALPLTVKAGADQGGNAVWTLSELGLSVDTAQAKAAIARLREGGMWERAKYRLHFPDKLSVEIQWDTSAFIQKIRSRWGYLNANEPVNATRKITDDDKVVYTPHTDAYRLDADSMLAAARQKVAAYLAEEWGTADSVRQPGKPEGEGGQSGEQGIAIKLGLKVVYPDVTLDRLKAEGVERKIASFTTDFHTSAAGRAYNVTVTAQTLNDWDLAPGETFDYGKVISLTRKKYGYREAPVILNGKLTPGIGGGICQVSSTLYNTALLAGLNMTERRNHSLPVSYLPLGRDATFAEGAINFRFKNTTGKHLIIRTVVSNRSLTVKLFGTLPQNVSYSLDSETVKELEPPVKEAPSSALPTGSRRLVTSGKTGYIVETYRIKTVDGKTVSRERISRDTYKAQPAVYDVGTGGDRDAPHGQPAPAPEKQLLEDGVGEQ